MQKQNAQVNGESIDINSIDPALKGVASNPVKMALKDEALESKGLGTKKKRTKKPKEVNAAKTENQQDPADNQGTERNYETGRGMISTTGEQAETVADMEAQNAQFSRKKQKMCSSLVFIMTVGLLIAFGLGAGFSYLMLKTFNSAKSTRAQPVMADQFEQTVGEVNEPGFDPHQETQSGNITTPPNRVEPHTQPNESQNQSNSHESLMVQDITITQSENKIQVQWEVEVDPKRDVLLEEFKVQLMSKTGRYEGVPCLGQAVNEDYIALSCDIDVSDREHWGADLNDLRIQAPNLHYYYAEPAGYDPEWMDTPQISINEKLIVVQWSVFSGHLAGQAHFKFEAMGHRRHYTKVECDHFSFTPENDDYGIARCEFDQLAFMQKFGLEYGMKVHIRLQGVDGGFYEASVGGDLDDDELIPYVSDELVFGYHNFQYFPLDYENGAYPAMGQMEDSFISEYDQLSQIKILERITHEGTKRLHGIQLKFSDDSESPYFKGYDTTDELHETVLNLDEEKQVASIQMKLFRDQLTGIRMIDQEGEYIINYTWQQHYETGEWSEEQKVGAGRSIVGLVVNEPQKDIYRIAFLLWDRFPEQVKGL